MSVEINVTVTAKMPPSIDLTIDITDDPFPTEPAMQETWRLRFNERVQEALQEVDEHGSGYEGYIAEYINEYAGGYDIEVREGPSYGPSFLTPEDIQEANRL